MTYVEDCLMEATVERSFCGFSDVCAGILEDVMKRELTEEYSIYLIDLHLFNTFQFLYDKKTVVITWLMNGSIQI